MSIFNAFKIGFQQLFRYWRMWFLYYFMTLGAALLVGLPIKSYLESNAGDSLIINDLIKGFNYTFINDFLNNYGDGFSAILQQSILVIGLFLIIMIFFVGGSLSIFKQQSVTFDKSIFWGSAAHYFWKMLRMTVYFLLIHGAVIALFLFIYYLSVRGFDIEKLKNDTPIFSTWNWLIPIYVVVAAFFFTWHDYAKVILIDKNSKWLFQPISQAFRFVTHHFLKTYPLFLLNLALLGVLFFINHLITQSWEINSSSMIWWSFLWAQCFVFLRLGIKLLNWSSATALYQSIK